MSANRVLTVVLLLGAVCAVPARAIADPETCVALDSVHPEGGYLFSAEFSTVDPQARELATQEWERYANFRGFESMGCDQRTYKEEAAGLPADSKIVNTGWKPSREALLAGALAIKSGKRNYRNGSDCLHTENEAIVNTCEYPVSVAYCFRDPMSGNGNSFDKTCTAQKFGTLLSLAAGTAEKVGTYHYVYYFACETPALPTGLSFDGNTVTGVCNAP
jgi:hypothetical protein